MIEITILMLKMTTGIVNNRTMPIISDMLATLNNIYESITLQGSEFYGKQK
jgi:hypothetical protein